MTQTKTVDYIQFIVIDLFCGAGGTTTGFEEAEFDYSKLYEFLQSIGAEAPQHRDVFVKTAKVVACVNHDPLAIKSHWANHPDVEHFEEDITSLYGFVQQGMLFKSPKFLRLVRLIDMYRAFYPDAKIILWASLECTNFSKAKGGKPRDADSRTLANHLHPYIIGLNPDYIQIENVVEFMSWGPLDKDGKPESRKNGIDWMRWRKAVCNHGYTDEWKEINSADFGALTSRNRLFGCFAKPDLPIVWPTPTHSKNPAATSIYSPLRKWEPVKKALDFNDEGNSVFNRKKPLSSKTMQRLFMGCVKHIAGGKKAFLSRYNGGNAEHRNHDLDSPSGSLTTSNRLAFVNASFITKGFSSNSGRGVNAGSSVNEPCPTIATQNRLGIAQASFISKYNGVNGGKHDNSNSVDGPVGALTTGDTHAKVTASFIQKYYSTGGQHNSIDEPAASITTKDRLSKVSAFFIDKQYSGGHNHQSVEQPAGTIVTNDKHKLVSVEVTPSEHHYLMNPSWGGNSGSIDQPCHVVIARQDKAPLYLISCAEGPIMVPVYSDDCEWTIKLKEFMAMYGIADIKMRMLKVSELKVIQGFPANYILEGNQTDQKKFIGNAVHPRVPKAWIKAKSERLLTALLAA